MRTIRTPKRRKAFLLALAEGNSVTGACQAAGISRRAAYEWRDADALFAAEWDDCCEESVDLLEDEARRRAMAQSDLLLIFLLKARRPLVYREPRAAIMAMSLSPEEMRSLVEESRRLRELPTGQIEAELSEMQRRRQLANGDRGNILHKANGAAAAAAGQRSPRQDTAQDERRGRPVKA